MHGKTILAASLTQDSDEFSLVGQTVMISGVPHIVKTAEHFLGNEELKKGDPILMWVEKM